MIRKFHFYILIISFQSLISISVAAQDTLKNKTKIEIGVDLVNKYLWRGQLFDASPNIQPFINLKKGGFTLGTWGTYGTLTNFGEIDLSLSYKYKWFSIQAYDYFVIPNDQAENYNYFNYKSKTTKHSFDCALVFEGGDKFPLKLTFSNFLYGDDRNSLGNNYYSSYFEAGYPFNIGKINLNIFLGLTDRESCYGKEAGVVNAGITAVKKIKINSDYEIPISCSLISNPQKEKIFLILMISL